MASLKIHPDLYNFRRTRKGFTDRQIAAFAIAVVVAIATTALLGYAIGLNYMIAVTVGVIVAAPFVVGGVFPLFETLYGMPAEEFFQNISDYSARGGAISWRGEEAPSLKCEVTRDYKKKRKAKGVECEVHEGLA